MANRLYSTHPLTCAAVLSVSLIVSTLQAAPETAPSQDARYGAHLIADGFVHFGVYAPDASAVDLLLFDDPAATAPNATVPLQRAGTDFRIRVRGPGIGPGLHYLLRADGPRAISTADFHGPLFNPHFRLGDPYAHATQNTRGSAFFIATPFVDLQAPVYAGGGKSIVYDHSADAHPGRVEIAPEDLIVYELHVQDYTARLDALDPALRGTYLGLAQPGLTTPDGLAAGLDHLVELGVNAVELMPVMEYDEETGNAAERYNHWGYMTTQFFAPEARYASVAGRQIVELKQLIRALHARGIAVLLDAVYNHTAEGSPWLQDSRLAAKCFNLMCLAAPQVFRGTGDGRHFLNNTGTGNDLDYGGGARYTKRLVLDSLAHWREAYGIDGFRFDLARILADGSADAADWIDNEPRLSGAHLHAEPWDLGGQWWDFMDNYGWSAANNRWAKWLGRYRDQVRRFSASKLHSPRAFKQLIEGRGAVAESAGPPASTRPWRSINFIAAHDGYTLRDCLFFNDDDGSHNCWDSGNDENLRRLRSKLSMGILLTSQGVPLILQGDEFGATKAAAGADAKNTYNYESTHGDAAVDHVNWLDWRLKDGDRSASPQGPEYGRELFEWTRDLIALRKRHAHFRRADFAEYVAGVPASSGNDGRYSYAWEGRGEGAPAQLAVIWWGRAAEPDLMVIYNEHFEPFTVNNLAHWSQGDWQVLARSWETAEHDFCPAQNPPQHCPAAQGGFGIPGRGMAILISDND